MRTVLALTIVFLSVGFARGVQIASSGPKYRESQLLIKFREGSAEQEIARFERDFSLRKINRFEGCGVRHYRLPAELTVPEAMDLFSQHDLVTFAEPNFVRKLSAFDSPHTNQWYLKNTGQKANGIAGSAGDDINWIAGINKVTTVNSVTVAVVDTGMAINHEDLVANIWVNPSETLNGQDDDGNGLIDDIFGYDFSNRDAQPYDETGHGSLVAGILGGVANNGLGIAGVCPLAKMMALRVSDQFGLISVADLIPAFDYARRKGAKIVNCSFGGFGYSSSERAAIEALGDAGILVVCAAGNDALDIDRTPVFPAAYNLSNMITVAATGRNLGLASFSNYGANAVQVAAPGTDMFSTTVTRLQGFPAGSEVIPSDWTSGGVGVYDWRFITSGPTTYLSDGSLNSQNDDSQPYAPDTDTWMRSPRISLASFIGSQLSFSAVYDLADDFVSIETSSNGVSWTTIGFIEGTSNGRPEPMDYDLAFADGQNLYFRFHLIANESVQGAGIKISNIRITRVSDVADGQSTAYGFKQGTSFAAPVVSGVAALALAQRPDLTYGQVKNLILSQVRPVAALAGKVGSGGIVDAGRVMTALGNIPISNSPPIITVQPVSQTVTSGDTVNFRIAAIGAAPLTYQWFFNGKAISDANRASYSIASVQLAQAGSYSAVVSNSFGSTTSANAALVVDGASALGIVGAPFSYQIVANNAPTWFSASGLPPGLLCDGATGLISGIPTGAGTYHVKVQARNIFSTASGTIVIVIKPGSITSSTIADGVVGTPFAFLLAANNAPTWFSASGLPPGLICAGATGLIFGTPTGAGTYHVKVEARNLFGTASATMVITILPGAITSAGSASGIVGVPFAFLISADNTPTWFSASGLPPGLRVNGSLGLISGTPTTPGTYHVEVEARNLFASAFGTMVIVIENGSIIGGTASQPALSVAVSGQNFLLSWPTNNSEGFVLQETQLQQNSWSNSPAAVVVQGNEKVASIPVHSTVKFYRLRKLLRQ
jgi:subtilisin family serine protease